jgi:hypothetical protein
VDVCVSRASAVVVQRIPPAAADWFLDWQRSVTAAAEGFAGYRATEVYPPANGSGGEWVVVIHFDDEELLQQWLDSAVRARWLQLLREKVGDFELKTLPGGFGFWFAGQTRNPDAPPPSWMMALTVLLGLYPTVMLLTIFVGPHTSPLGLALSMLIGNALSVSILQWGVMPILTRMLAPWLHADGSRKKVISTAGLCLILLLLAGLAGLFRQVTG